MASLWRYFATRLHGDGTETLVATELPLAGPRVQRAVSGPGGVTGTVPVEVERLRGPDGRPVFTEWATAVYAELDGRIVGAGLVPADGLTKAGPSLSLSTVGFTAYLRGVHYEGESAWVQVDPADLVRHAWEHAQGFAGGDLGLVVDDLATPARVGEEERDVAFTTATGEQVEFSSGPVKWNTWTTHDLGAEVDRLCQDHSIDYLEHHTWSGETVRHRLQLGHPRIGTRRQDLRFVVGENVTLEPSVTAAAWASEVIVIGAGEGRTMRRGTTPARLQGRLRRPVVIVDKSLQSHAACQAEAAVEHRWRSGGDELSTLTVRDHDSAPIGSWIPGDEIKVKGSGQGWAGDLDGWVRILSDELHPDTDTATLTVALAGRT